MDESMSKKERFIAPLWCTQQVNDVHVCHRHHCSILTYCMICRESAALAYHRTFLEILSLSFWSGPSTHLFIYSCRFSLVPLPIFWNLLPKHLMCIMVWYHNYIFLEVSQTFLHFDLALFPIWRKHFVQQWTCCIIFWLSSHYSMFKILIYRAHTLTAFNSTQTI